MLPRLKEEELLNLDNNDLLNNCQSDVDFAKKALFYPSILTKLSSDNIFYLLQKNEYLAIIAVQDPAFSHISSQLINTELHLLCLAHPLFSNLLIKNRFDLATKLDMFAWTEVACKHNNLALAQEILMMLTSDEFKMAVPASLGTIQSCRELTNEMLLLALAFPSLALQIENSNFLDIHYLSDENKQKFYHLLSFDNETIKATHIKNDSVKSIATSDGFPFATTTAPVQIIYKSNKKKNSRKSKNHLNNIEIRESKPGRYERIDEFLIQSIIEESKWTDKFKKNDQTKQQVEGEEKVHKDVVKHPISELEEIEELIIQAALNESNSKEEKIVREMKTIQAFYEQLKNEKDEATEIYNDDVNYIKDLSRYSLITSDSECEGIDIDTYALANDIGDEATFNLAHLSIGQTIDQKCLTLPTLSISPIKFLVQSRQQDGLLKNNTGDFNLDEKDSSMSPSKKLN